jgi:predicted transcriptional regulator
MKISSKAAAANQQLLHKMQTKWKQQELLDKVEDRTYFKFLAHSTGVFDNISPMERELLDTIVSCNVEPLTVGETMTLTAIASPATLHRKISNLISAGLITQTSLNNNRRTKYLVATNKCLQQYDALNKAMKEACK